MSGQVEKGQFFFAFIKTTLVVAAWEKLSDSIVETAAVIKLTNQRGRADRDLSILSR